MLKLKGGTIKAEVIFSPTSSGGLETVKQVDPLDVVGERGVGHQGLVAVDVVDCKFKCQLVHTHQLTLAGLENTACQHTENVTRACFIYIPWWVESIMYYLKYKN